MLERLRVDNLIILRAAEIEPARGLTAITGETGAGKTVFAGALGLVLGQKGDAGLVGPHDEALYVEATFDVAEATFADGAFDGLRDLVDDLDDGLVLARRLGPDGRGRALVQGRATTRGALTAAGERLVGVVSQHEARRLARPAVQRAILDAFLGEAQTGRLDRMERAWRELAAARQGLAEAEAARAGIVERTAELEGIVERIDRIQPRSGEDGELATERDRLRYADELAAGTAAAAELLSPDDGEGALGLAGRAERALRAAVERDPSLLPYADELRTALVSLEEVSRSLHAYAHDIDHDPARLEQIEARLDQFADLARRHGSLDEAIAAGERARADLAVARGDDGAIVELAAAVAAAEAEVDATVADLRAARRDGAPALAAAVQEHLADLGMAEARVVIDVSEHAPGPTGADAVAILLAPNPGLPAAPVADAASGGELSRVALALRVAAHARDAVPTLVFDEVDAGIGGATAVAVARKLRELAATTQVICITHLAQIAAVADRHFRVVKEPGDPTETRIERLDEAGVEAELARMLGGDAEAAEARELARRLRAEA